MSLEELERIANAGSVSAGYKSPRHPRGKSTICAVCHFEFFGREARNLHWCKSDGYYVCNRCWETSCLKKHGRKDKGADLRAGQMGVFIVFCFLFPFTLPGIYDALLVSQWNGIPETPVGSLEDSGTAKVRGNLWSPGNFAIGYTESVDDEGDLSTTWDLQARFRIEDGTGSVYSATAEYFDIRPSGYDARLPGRQINGPVYPNGTAVIATGELKTESGLKVFYVKYLAREDEGIVMDYINIVPAAVFMPLLLTIYLMIGASLSKRKRTHLSMTGEAIPATLAGDHLDQKDTDVEWHFNDSMGPSAASLWAMASCVAIGVILPILLLLFWKMTLQDLYLFALLFSLVSMFLFIAPAAFVLWPAIVPLEVGASKRGIHLWYPTPGWRLLRKSFIPWEQVVSLGLAETGKSTWAIKVKGPEEFNVVGITDSNRSFLEKAWGERRAAAYDASKIPAKTD